MPRGLKFVGKGSTREGGKGRYDVERHTVRHDENTQMVQAIYTSMNGADHSGRASDLMVAVSPGKATPTNLRAALGDLDSVVPLRYKADQRSHMRREHAQEATTMLQAKMVHMQVLLEAYTQWSTIEAKSQAERSPGEEYFVKLIGGLESKYSLLSRHPDSHCARRIKNVLDKLSRGEVPSTPLPDSPQPTAGRPSPQRWAEALERARHAAHLKAEEESSKSDRLTKPSMRPVPVVRPTSVRAAAQVPRSLLSAIGKSSSKKPGAAAAAPPRRKRTGNAVHEDDGSASRAAVDALFDNMIES